MLNCSHITLPCLYNCWYLRYISMISIRFNAFGVVILWLYCAVLTCIHPGFIPPDVWFVGLRYNWRIVPQDPTETCPGTIPFGESAVQISTFLIVLFISSFRHFVLMMVFSEQWVFLPDSEQRSQLVLPPPAHVDYRAACFCHRNLIEIGYVCSVCLSSKFGSWLKETNAWKQSL